MGPHESLLGDVRCKVLPPGQQAIGIFFPPTLPVRLVPVNGVRREWPPERRVLALGGVRGVETGCCRTRCPPESKGRTPAVISDIERWSSSALFTPKVMLNALSNLGIELRRQIGGWLG